MSTTYRSFAKINLSLRVLGRRPDGYHELSTVFQTVDLSDLITIERTGAGIELSVEGDGVPGGPENLAHRAATRFIRDYAPDLGVRIGLRKRIPVGGGLGGGSSNAACVLTVLQKIVGRPGSVQELLEMAATLGADVPYFLVGGTVHGRGRGDRLTRLPDLSTREVCLVTPPVAISTAEIFGAYACPPDTGTPAPGRAGSVGSWRDLDRERNDLQELVFERYPVVRDVYNALVEAGAAVVRLSGTGATLFAFFGGSTATSEWTTSLPPGSRVVLTKTLTRSSLDRHRVVR